MLFLRLSFETLEVRISAFERECTKCDGNAGVDRAPSPAALPVLPRSGKYRRSESNSVVSGMPGNVLLAFGVQ
jgi:hypothetical protein